MAESGVADYVTTFWTGVMAPAGTPPDIVDRLNAAIDFGLKSPEMRDSLTRTGAQPAPGTAAEFAKFIADETKKWSAIAKTAGVAMQ